MEWIDHGARYYDAQLGRWHTPDPADQFSSPYVGMGNNPVTHVDPDGRILPLIIIGAAVIGGALNVAAHWHQISTGPHGFRDGLVAFGIGGAAGALTAVTGGAAGVALTGMFGAGAASTILGGAAIGAVGAAFNSMAQQVGNAAYFGDPYSLQKLGTDIAFGAATGGVFNGAVKGIQYLKGLRSPAASLGETQLEKIAPNELPSGPLLEAADNLGEVGVGDLTNVEFPRPMQQFSGSTVDEAVDYVMQNKTIHIFDKITHNLDPLGRGWRWPWPGVSKRKMRGCLCGWGSC